MLTKITVDSQWTNLDPLVLNVINKPDEDLFEVRNIDGLGPVNANVNTTPMGSIAGEHFVGSSVGKRNIVLTLGLDPDWNEWTISKLRRLLDKYFMPQQSVNLTFETMEFSPVGISGYIESNDPNMFSKDPEQQISIICPDLYFKAVDATTISSRTDADPAPIDYQGNVETGFFMRISRVSDPAPVNVKVQVNDSNPSYINVGSALGGAPVDGTKDLYVCTLPGSKYVETVRNIDPITVENRLSDATISGRWPLIGPGTDTFEVISDAGVQSWILTYFEMFGSL